MDSIMPVSPEDIRTTAKYVYDVSGIVIDQSKAYLIETRLGGMLKEFACPTYSQLCLKAKADATRNMERRIVDAISTNETLFFRDASPFEMLKFKILPELIDRRSTRAATGLPLPIRIWSAACSTGQEVYSIAIVLKELLPDPKRFAIHLLGTDISDAAVRQASYGTFNKFEIERGLPPDKLQRYFVSANGDGWKIRDEIRAMATFRKLNLMLPFTGLGKFDIIFCRNVAIYFSAEDRQKLFTRLAAMLEPDGCLIIGGTESLTGICPQFQPQRHLRGVYYTLVH